MPSTRSRSRARRKNGKNAEKSRRIHTVSSPEAEKIEEPSSPSNGKAEMNGENVEVITTRGWGRIPLWLIVCFSAIGALYFAASILFPVTLAFVLYFLLAPLVRLLTRLFRLPEAVSASVVVLGVTIGIAAASYVLAGPISDWISNAPETLQKAEQELRFLIKPVDQIDEATEKVSNLTGGATKKGVIRVAIDQPPISSYLLNATMNFIAGMTITVALVYLLLAMGHRTLNSIVELMPTMQDKKGIVAMIRNIEEGISSYLVTVTAINIGLGVVIGVALGLLGFPDPLLLGISAAILNYIPYVGCVIGIITTFLIGIVYLDPTQGLIGAGVYLFINTIEGNVVTTMILGRSMKLNPPIVFISIVFWGWVWGIGGILIAVPLLGIAKIACDHIDRLQPLARIMSG